MAKKVKKVISALVAVASLATCAIGMNASAINYATKYFPNNLGEGYLTVSSDSMYGYTKSYSYNRVIDIDLYDYSPQNGCTYYTSRIVDNKREIHVSGGTFSSTIHNLSTTK